MIQPHKTWNVIDSSKLDTWLDCPRQYFFTYILGWRVDQPNHDLYFGQSWHIAREHQLINGYEDVKGAFLAFMDYYREEFPQETDAIYQPKDPTAVALALNKLAKLYKRDLEENELLYSETSGTVPINYEGRALHYRMDSILRRKEDGKIFSWDHKTTKSFSRTWAEKFHLSVQNGTYTHCLYCMYPIEDVIGIEFCGVEFKFLKRGGKVNPAGYNINFQRVPAWKTPDQMNVWLWNVNQYVDAIEEEQGRLDDCSENDAVMMCFPMNTNSCTKYWGCAFHDYCLSWSNPLQRCHEPPLGFREEFWDPRKMETTNKINLEWR